MSDNQLAQMLAHAGVRMATDLEARLSSHKGENGAAREKIIQEFLRSYLPKRFDVSSGFVFDANGAVSQQLDIIIADSLVSPRFETPGEIRYYPCESVVAVGQVKSKISSRKELWDAFRNLRSVSSLDRTARGQAICKKTGEPIDHMGNHLHRIFTFVFVIDSSVGPDTARHVLIDYIHRSEPHLWPNIVFSLNKYLITYHCDGGVCPNTMDARGIACLATDNVGENLIRFYILLNQAVGVTSVSMMSSWAHLGDVWDKRATSDVMYPSVDNYNYPPYLHKLKHLPWVEPYGDPDYDGAREDGKREDDKK